MTPDIFIDDEFKSLIPALAPEEYAQLEANILAEGCRDALVLWDDVLVDGHNRYGICQKHGIPFKTVQATAIQGYDDAVLWIVRNQLGRRNITDFVRGELALRAKPIIEARAKAKQATSTGGAIPQLMQKSAEAAPVTTRAELAKAAGVSHDTIRKIEKIQETATPEVLASVRSGEISINVANKVAALPVERQAAIAAAGPVEMKKAVAQTRSEERPAKAPEPTEEEKLREALAEVREAASLLAEELEAYRAVEAGTQFEEIKQLQDRNRILKSQLDDYITQNQKLKKQVKMLERRAGGQNA
jgi:DNA-binding XRE family transcriptional regulator